MAYVSRLPPPPSVAASTAPQTYDLIIGNRYRAVEELGRGGMGVVYRVQDLNLAKEVALKQVFAREHSERWALTVSLFEREFFVLAQLAHPRVIAVYDYGVDPGGPFYTMELLEGGDLRELSPLPVARACALAIEVCSSLALLHAHRLVHRDVSPRNIRCTRDGHAKLIDFGAMVPMGPCSQTVGNPAFVAPEVVTHSALDGRTDLFSFGATLYYALTGQPPFPVRQFAELRALWRNEPTPPSQLVSGIPPALDALCASLLRIDPAQRPRTAFEVMQRLQAIAGVQVDEPIDVRESYLLAPKLVGRERALRRFRQCMQSAAHGSGAALAFEGTDGMGRSRALDACVLEAKTLGANVVRATATTAKVRFGLAQQLLEQLLDTMGETAVSAARTAQVWPVLFEQNSSATAEPRLRELGDPTLERASLQAAIAAWIACICESHSVMIAVDDVQRADEPSQALLAALTLDAHDKRLLVHMTIDSDERAGSQLALKVLREHALVEPLRPLDRPQTQELLSYVFGQVPHLTLLAEALFQVALGNPGETMELARHLVGTGLVRYENGQWTLPSQLNSGDLPASTGEVLAARVAALPPLARRLAEAQALVDSGLRRVDYALLAPDATMSEIDAAISTLLDREILHSDGAHYRLSHRALCETLAASLGAAQKRERHLALYELYRRQPNSHPYFVVHHLLAADRVDAALDLLATLHAGPLDLRPPDLDRVEPSRLVHTLERALELAALRERPARELNALRGRIVGVIHLVERDELYARYAPPWLAQLAHDSGLDDYRALDPSLAPATRLQQALTSAAARFDATSERERVYSVQDAIRLLVLYVAMSVVQITRTGDVQLATLVPGLLEPFVSLSPILFAVWQNVSALREYSTGRRVQARKRWGDVYELLQQSTSEANPWIAAMRDGVAQGIAKYEASIGNKVATNEWAAKLESKALHRVGAMYELRLACLMHGDSSGAEHFRRQAELLALRNSPRQMFDPTWAIELTAWWALRDLTGVGQVVDAMRGLAARRRGWRSTRRAAEGVFHLLRSDLSAAQVAFEEARTEACVDGSEAPHQVFAWTDATAGLMAVWLERGEPARAVAIGERAMAVCAAQQFELSVIPIGQQLALAEAQLGLLAPAASRIEELIATQIALGMRGLQLAQSYVVRVRIALGAHDRATATRFAALAAGEPGGSQMLAAAVRNDPVATEAQRAGVDLALAPSAFEAALLGVRARGPDSPAAVALRDALQHCTERHARAERALTLLCDLVDGARGQLYLAGPNGALDLAAATEGAAPNQHAMEFARAFFTAQRDLDTCTSGLTRETQMLSAPGRASYFDEKGEEARLFTLSCTDRGMLVYVGLAVVRIEHYAPLPSELTLLLTVLASCFLPDADTIASFSS